MKGKLTKNGDKMSSVAVRRSEYVSDECVVG